jgi:hypothetical protein
LAQHLIEAGLDDPRRLVLAPFEILVIQLEAMMFREWGIACGIYIEHAKEADDVYLGHVEKYKGAVRNTINRINESEQ